MKTQIWIAVAVYVLVAILRKRLGRNETLYEILQVLSVNLFEQTPILQPFDNTDSPKEFDRFSNQLILPGL